MSINILHLSDLHLREKQLAKDLCKGLLSDLRHWRGKRLEGMGGAPVINRIDVVVVSGDLVWQGDESEFNAALTFLNDFIADSTTDGLFTNGKSHVIIVPGNHDVERKHPSPSDRLNHYERFLTGFLKGVSLSSQTLRFSIDDNRYFTMVTTKIQGRDIMFIGLCSVKEVTKSYPSGSLPSDYLNNVKNEIRHDLEEDLNTLKVVILHHGGVGYSNKNLKIQNVNWEQILKTFKKEWGVKFLLHGHIHKAQRKITSFNGEEFCAVFSAGSTSLDSQDMPQGHEHVDRYQYQIVSIHDDNTLYLYQRSWDRFRIGTTPERSGEWVADSDADGRWVHAHILGDTGSRPSLSIDKAAQFLEGFPQSHTGASSFWLSYHCAVPESPIWELYRNIIRLNLEQQLTFYPTPDSEKGYWESNHSLRPDREKKWKEALDSTTFLIIDSSHYNDFTGKTLDALRRNNMGVTVRFESKNSGQSQHIVYGIDSHEIRESSGKDYAIIVRAPNVFVQNSSQDNSERQGTILIAAGLHRPATKAAITMVSTPEGLAHLFSRIESENWIQKESLSERQDLSELYFECVFEVDKREEPDGSVHDLNVRIKYFDDRLSSKLGSRYSDRLPPQVLRSLISIHSSMEEPKNKAVREEYAHKAVEQIDLYTVHLDLTRACPFHCKACIEGKYRTGIDDKANNVHFKLARVLDILHQLKKLGVRNIGLYGGEPMAHPNFALIIKTAADMGFILYLVSNGFYLADEEKFRAIQDCKDRIRCRFSIDTTKPTQYVQLRMGNKRICRDKDFFKKHYHSRPEELLKAIRKKIGLLVKAGVVCEESYLLSPDNYKDLRQAYDKASKTGIALFHIRPCTDIAAGSIHNGFRHTQLDNIRRDLDHIRKEARFYSADKPKCQYTIPKWFESYLNRPAEGWKHAQVQENSFPCYSCLYRLVISPIDGGKLVFCAYRRLDPEFQEDLSYLNSKDKLTTIRQKQFRNIWKKHPCVGCLCNRIDDNRQVTHKAAWKKA